MSLQELDDTACDLSRIAGVGTPAIFRPWVHAGHEVELDDVAVNLMNRLGMHDMRWHQENWGAEGRRRQVHEPEEVPEEEVVDQSLSLYGEAFLQPADPTVLVENMSGLHLHREAEAEVLLQVGFEVPPLIVGHRHHHLERPARPAEGEQLGDLGLREAAELDVAQWADSRNNGAGAAGLLLGRWRIH